MSTRMGHPGRKKRGSLGAEGKNRRVSLECRAKLERRGKQKEKNAMGGGGAERIGG